MTSGPRSLSALICTAGTLIGLVLYLFNQGLIKAGIAREHLPMSLG